MVDTKISELTSGGAILSSDAIPVVRSGANVRVTVGTAAAKTASDNSKANLASVAAAVTTGNLAVFTDTSGTVGNGGAPAAVATSGAYNDLTGKPSLAAVATTGAYNDLTGKPTLGTAAALTAGGASGAATLDSGGTLTPAQLPANVARLDAVQAFSKQHNTAGGALTDGASIAWNLDDAQTASVTLGGNRTLANPTNMAARGTYLLIVKQDATGGRTLAYGSAFKWPGGLAPVLSTAANAVDILSFVSDGTSMFGVAQYAFA